jgi:hypothetical protein
MRERRGNALPETMIVAAFLMMMMFGTINLTILGYQQVQADGASFIGARAAALQSQTNQANAQTAAQTQIAAVFPHVQASAVAVTSAGTSVASSAAVVTETGPTLPFLSGSSGALRILSHTDEPTTFSSPPPTDIAFQINSAALKNYVDWASKASTPTHQAHLAVGMRLWCNDPVLPQGAPCDQGVLSNDEVCYHDNEFDLLRAGQTYGFPTSGTSGKTARATALAEINNFAPTNANSPQYTILNWDAGTTGNFSNACPGVNWYPSPTGT